jgi:hypothetical protein
MLSAFEANSEGTHLVVRHLVHDRLGQPNV